MTIYRGYDLKEIFMASLLSVSIVCGVTCIGKGEESKRPSIETKIDEQYKNINRPDNYLPDDEKYSD